MSTVKTNAILDASGGNTATINSMTPTADSLQGQRNRIINGDMRIDQRNAGAAVTVNSGAQTFSVDRWYGQGTGSAGVFTLQRSTTALTGFVNSVVATVTTIDSSLSSGDLYLFSQRVEGFNIADLGWGTANAKSVTLSFWVRSSVTGTFGGSFSNSATNRSYPFTYTINSANTYEYKTITVAGDTSGTWLTDNGIGIFLYWGFGVGSTYSGTAGAWSGSYFISATGATNLMATNGATWYITGAQLEVGSVATPFERRDYGRELALCQRYYYKTAPGSGKYLTESAFGVSTTTAYGSNKFPVTMRTTPSALEQSGTASNYTVIRCGSASSVTCSAVPAFAVATEDRAFSSFPVSSGLTNSGAGSIEAAAAAAYLAWSAEL